MKRILLIISIILLPQALVCAQGKTISKTQLTATVSGCRQYEGAELVKLGRLATAALKKTIRLSSANDSDARQVLSLMKGIREMAILDYSDCSENDKESISRKLERALSGGEMLMEASDEGGKMRIYGVVDDKTDTVRDFVMYAPSDCALICIFGSISLKTVAKMASND
jgi:hypothetical protein